MKRQIIILISLSMAWVHCGKITSSAVMRRNNCNRIWRKYHYQIAVVRSEQPDAPVHSVEHVMKWWILLWVGARYARASCSAIALEHMTAKVWNLQCRQFAKCDAIKLHEPTHETQSLNQRQLIGFPWKLICAGDSWSISVYLFLRIYYVFLRSRVNIFNRPN